MPDTLQIAVRGLVAGALLWLAGGLPLARGQGEPPALNPFAPRDKMPPAAEPGFIELSDGRIVAGQIYLTRDARLRVFDEQSKRIREIPLRVVREIKVEVRREWMEREWRFREAASDKKVYTGREYPAREYVHVFHLKDGRTIRGPVSAPIYIQSKGMSKPQRFILYKRHKGPVGSTLSALVYVRRISLGKDALQEAESKLAQQAHESHVDKLP